MDHKQKTRLYTVNNGFFDYEPAVPCISATNIGYMAREEFRSFMERGLELIREKIDGQSKAGWLADISKAATFNPSDTAWLINNWNPAAYDAGLRYCAFVLPECGVADLNVIDYSELTTESATIIVQHFKDMESAKSWLREVINEC